MKCKRDFDARKLDHKTLEVLRKQAVRRVVEDGEAPDEVADSLQVNRATVYHWLSAFHYGGWSALDAKAIPGRPPKLDGKQMAWLAKTIRSKNPLQLHFEYALWTVSMVREVIRRQFDVKLSEVSVGRLLKTLGFSAQRPLHRAWQQQPALVEEWLNVEFPKLKRRAKRENAVIFFADESGIRSDHHAGTTWAPRGQTPIIKATGQRFSLNMISAVSAQGQFRFMTVEGTVTAATFIEFIDRLVTGMEQKIYLVLDRHRIHRAKVVQQHVTRLKEKIELVYLPPYSPELNPDEQVWAHVKGRIGRKLVENKMDLKKKLVAVMQSLQRMPEKVMGFFRNPTCRYAA